MKVPRGFLAKANRISLGLRHQLSLDAHAPMDVPRLVKHLNLELVPLSEFLPTHTPQIQTLCDGYKACFSATLLSTPAGRKILFNDSPAREIGRHNSDVAHEISHHLLVHPPSPPFDEDGNRHFSSEIEDEANCLASFLLIPNEAAWHIVKSGMRTDPACNVYGVSKEMLEFRLNKSGARIRFARSRVRLG